MRSSLPNVVIFATGGTIAGSAGSRDQSTGYTSGVVGIEALIQAVPEMLNITNIVGSQISNLNSGAINSTIIMTMSKLANELLCAPNSTTDGLVITHGTDTLEETAFFMDITLECAKPIVIVGAMRPSTAISADGPGNLLQAVTLAALPSAKGRGAMIVLNDRIGAAWYTEKTNANVLDTFRAIEQGYIGGFLNNKPFFYYPASQPLFKETFSTANFTTAPLPRVDILIAYEDFTGDLIPAAIANGAKGFVIAGAGAGNTGPLAVPHIAAALAAGVPIVVSTKTNGGAVEPGSDVGQTVKSGFLNPVKSRLQLQLALAHSMGLEEVRAAFENKLGKFLL
ncbi:hypothetical protein RQP46_004127 [Phenoliferia psychrophenolica]